jgi:hypothetical protein
MARKSRRKRRDRTDHDNIRQPADHALTADDLTDIILPVAATLSVVRGPLNGPEAAEALRGACLPAGKDIGIPVPAAAHAALLRARAVPRIRASTASTSRLRQKASFASSRSVALKRSART